MKLMAIGQVIKGCTQLATFIITFTTLNHVQNSSSQSERVPEYHILTSRCVHDFVTHYSNVKMTIQFYLGIQCI